MFSGISFTLFDRSVSLLTFALHVTPPGEATVGKHLYTGMPLQSSFAERQLLALPSDMAEITKAPH